jgi:hypothetical protein
MVKFDGRTRPIIIEQRTPQRQRLPRERQTLLVRT